MPAILGRRSLLYVELFRLDAGFFLLQYMYGVWL